MDDILTLPEAQSPNLCLTNPTSKEFEAIYGLNFQEWGDALTLPQYLEESTFSTSVPMAKDGGMSVWFLTDKTLPLDHRPILCSCETFRNQTYITDPKGRFSEAIIHSVASVFCNPSHRRHGYATRLLAELAKILPKWQAEAGQCIGSVLFSDIGTAFYAKRGWHPFPLNHHIELDPMHVPNLSQLGVRFIVEEDLDQFCKDDKAMIRGVMTRSSSTKTRLMIVPDLDHMLWHLRKEEFACDRIFGKQPKSKGAITGEPNDRIWVLWTHRYYGHPDINPVDNTLYILRVVIENQKVDLRHREHQVEQLRAVLWAAQSEAAEWDLRTVKLWDPGHLLQDIVERTGAQHRTVERGDEGIASLMWFGEGDGKEDMVEWLGNEKNLSRELKVHSNVAKRLLFQFHKQQNSKKPGSVHAVYLVTGYLIPVTPATSSSQSGPVDGEDAHMQSSPFMSSSMPQPEDDEDQLAVKTVTLCREEDLKDIKARSSGEISIHVYSLDPSTIQNIQLLSECNRTLAVKYAAEDPLQVGRQYGTIQNARVKRRTGSKPQPAQSAPANNKTTLAPKAATPTVKTEPKPNPFHEAKAPSSKALGLSQTKPKEATPQQQSTQQKKPATKTPALKKEKSDIFKSFAKPPTKISRENTGSSVGVSPAPPKVATPAPEEVPSALQDESMDDASDGEQLNDTLISEQKAAKSTRRTRSEREDQLKKMMEDDGDDDGDEAMPSPDAQPSQEPATSKASEKQEPTISTPAATATTTTSGGRRRGRRKVMKKKTIKDEEGYLVTKEEPGWESFSEDEPAPREATPVSTALSNPKTKKTTGRPGQGNIMSFFGKK
ncbi:MAG: hypothetical protein Q9168_006671 [Polycauliona sp. 1 TL-2023]